MKQILRTDRLTLRELVEADALFIIELVNSPGWLQFIGDKKISNEQHAVHYLQAGPLKSYVDHGFGLWMIEVTDEHTPIGVCGLLKRDYLDYPDIGFALLPRFEGKGYAREAALAILDFAKKRLAIQTVQAITLPYNARSIKLLEQIGLRFFKQVLTPGERETLHLYQRILE